MQAVDVAPTPQVVAAVSEVQIDANSLMAQWQSIRSQDIAALNQQLRTAGLPLITVEETK